MAPNSFGERGLLPLDEVLDEIWRTLHQLVAEDLDASEWKEFREWLESDGGAHDGSLYRLKTGAAVHFGPHGVFAKAVLLSPPPPAHDYLGGPEIVEDISRAFEARYSVDLLSRFLENTAPCVVTFVDGTVEPAAANSVFWFAYSMIRDGTLGSNANGGISLHGRQVPASDVVAVELAEAIPGHDNLYRIVHE